MLDNIVIFDLETTGVDVVNDRICSICCIKLVNGETIEKSLLINPTIKIPKEASDVHGITDEMVKDKPTFKQISVGVLEFLAGCSIGGFNSNKYDIPLLQAEFARCGIEWNLEGIAFVDVLALERTLNGNKLSDVYKRYTGTELEVAHDATVDVKATIEILKCQIEKHSLPTDAAELDKLTQGEKERADISGNLYKKEGEYYFAFGKHIGRKVLSKKQYGEWMLNQAFPRDTKKLLSAILNNKI